MAPGEWAKNKFMLVSIADTSFFVRKTMHYVLFPAHTKQK